MTIHPRKATGDRVRAELPALIGKWQQAAPGKLIPTAYATTLSAAVLGVSGGVVRKYLTDAVADGSLVEILVRRDWMVSIPCDGMLYAVPDGDLYRLTRDRPDSRGSDGISFLTTQKGYSTFLHRTEKKFPKND